MKAKDYRAQYEAQLKQTSDKAASSSEGTRQLLKDKGGDSATRAEAIERTNYDDSDLRELVEQYLKTLQDKSESVEVRLAALNELKVADILGSQFDPHRGDYLAVLRTVSTDASPTLRATAMEVLSLNGDAFAQSKLLEGLQDENVALVPTAKAIQFLSYDDHGNAAPVVRDLYESLDTRGKEEALRLLGSDPESEDLFSSLIRDKSQPESLRQLSAVGLQNLNPESFKPLAQDIVQDEEDYNEIRAICMAALTAGEFVDAADNDFLDTVTTLTDQTKSTNLRSSMKRYIRSAKK